MAGSLAYVKLQERIEAGEDLSQHAIGLLESLETHLAFVQGIEPDRWRTTADQLELLRLDFIEAGNDEAATTVGRARQLLLGVSGTLLTSMIEEALRVIQAIEASSE
jgi:hypothetical protein